MRLLAGYQKKLHEINGIKQRPARSVPFTAYFKDETEMLHTFTLLTQEEMQYIL